VWQNDNRSVAPLAGLPALNAGIRLPEQIASPHAPVPAIPFLGIEAESANDPETACDLSLHPKAVLQEASAGLLEPG